MKWNIIADSSCEIFDHDTPNGDVIFNTVPFYITAGSTDYIDNAEIDKDAMLDSMELPDVVSRTSCPSPYTWFEQFEQADNAIAITISSNLSGSYNSAEVACGMIKEKYPEKNVAVIDSRSAGPELIFIIDNVMQAIAAGKSFDEVVDMATRMQQHSHVIFALCSFNNLIKNGRMSKLTGFLVGKLGFWGIGIGSDEGTIQIKGKARSRKKAITAIIDDLRERAGAVKTVLISHCHNLETAEMLKAAIHETWADAEVRIMPTRGLCSYYAERGGLIVGFQDQI